ncbi:MAG TPA: CoA-binding protein, partial [Thermodesulfobacteriota bacterium]|nr:CoA-binding protein [Thermodesulfobacteriota bacterium]
PDRLYGGVFRQAGVIRAESMTELFDFCMVLGSSPLPEGNRVVIQTHSGGPGAVAADSCGRSGLELPAFSQETLKALEDHVPHTGSLNNPVDLTYARNMDDYFEVIPKILLSDHGADGLLLYLMLPIHPVRRVLSAMGMPEEQIQEQFEKLTDQLAEKLNRLAKEQKKPIIGFSYRAQVDKLIKVLQNYGFPVIPSPHRAARAMAALNRYRLIRDRS